MFEENARIFWKHMNNGAEPDSVKLLEGEKEVLIEIVYKSNKTYVVGQSMNGQFIWRMADEYEQKFIATDIVGKNDEAESTS
jgi:predicted peptidase